MLVWIYTYNFKAIFWGTIKRSKPICNDVTLDHVSRNCTQTFITLLNIEWSYPVMCARALKQHHRQSNNSQHDWRAHLSLSVDEPSLWLRGCWCILETMELHTLSQARFMLLYIGRCTGSVISWCWWMLETLHFHTLSQARFVLLYNGWN